jgi:hypothetical protein
VARNSEADLAVLASDVHIPGNTPEVTGHAKQGLRVFIVGFNDKHTEKDNPEIQKRSDHRSWLVEERRHRVFTSKRTIGPATPAMLISGSICQPGESGCAEDVEELHAKITVVSALIRSKPRWTGADDHTSRKPQHA